MIAFRDLRVAERGEPLVVGHLEDSIHRGTARLSHPLESRNGHQTVALREAIKEHRFDVLIGGARRDEEKARAKERSFSNRDSFGLRHPPRRWLADHRGPDQQPQQWRVAGDGSGLNGSNKTQASGCSSVRVRGRPTSSRCAAHAAWHKPSAWPLRQRPSTVSPADGADIHSTQVVRRNP